MVGPIRKGRREVTTGVADQAMFAQPLPQIIYLPAPPKRGRRDSYSEEEGQKSSSSLSHVKAPVVAVEFPSIDLWLLTLEMKPKAHLRDFESMRNKFMAQDYLTMGVDDLATIPRSDFGMDGFGFNLAEVTFICKCLDETMNELRPGSKNRKAKRSKKD